MFYLFVNRLLVRRLKLTRCKQIISDDEAEYNNNDGEKTVGDEKHDRHADPKPEQNKSKKTFHGMSPSFP